MVIGIIDPPIIYSRPLLLYSQRRGGDTGKPDMLPPFLQNHGSDSAAAGMSVNIKLSYPEVFYKVVHHRQMVTHLFVRTPRLVAPTVGPVGSNPAGVGADCLGMFDNLPFFSVHPLVRPIVPMPVETNMVRSFTIGELVADKCPELLFRYRFGDGEVYPIHIPK